MSGALRSTAAPRCVVCGSAGTALYAGLRDRLFGVAGEWSFKACPNPACGVIWLDPMPLPEDIHKAYETYYTHGAAGPKRGTLARLFEQAKRGYLANRYGYHAGAPFATRLLGLLPLAYPGRAAELDFSVMWLGPGTRGRLLDVGAGSGWLVEHMRSLGWDAEGVDFDPRAVEAARARGLAIRAGSLPEQRYPESSFDAVTMSHCLEHVHDPLAWLVEARRVLKPGGRLAIATPNNRSLGHRVYGRDWFALDPPRHLHLFNRDALATLLARAGFERARLFTSIRDANGTFIAGRAIRRTGRHDMTRRPGAALLTWGRAMQLGEAAAKLLRPDCGEDLVAVAAR